MFNKKDNKFKKSPFSNKSIKSLNNYINSDDAELFREVIKSLGSK